MGRLLPGTRVPDSWAPPGMEPGYTLRIEGDMGYLCFGGEDVVARFDKGDYLSKWGRQWYMKFRADVMAAMSRHMEGRAQHA